MKLKTLAKIYDTPVEETPFSHCVIDDFFDEATAIELEKEFPDFHSNQWFEYDNPLEVKKTMNSWNGFPKATYKAFSELCSPIVSQYLSRKFNGHLYPDVGLHGGGWHIHGSGGKLNVHQDYCIHPKLSMQRKLNIIIYLSRNWDPSWGGGLQLWSHDHENNKPKELVKSIDVRFNRAVIFDTTQHSWHGFAGKLTCPEGVYRKSLAIYYVQQPDQTAEDRYRAHYAPSKEQENDPQILEFIEKRKSILPK